MPRVKCPHCGAGNQDATEKDTCWQCGNVLGDPVVRTEMADAAAPVTAGAPTRQLDPAHLPLPQMIETRPAEEGPRPLVLIMGVTVIVVAILVIALFVLTARK